MDHPGEEGAGVPDLATRVSRLEVNVDLILGVLTRLEPKLTELALTTARAADLVKLQFGLAELTHSTSKSADISKLQGDIGKVQADLSEVKGGVSSLPTWWMLMVTVLSTWLAGAGIVFTLVKATHP